MTEREELKLLRAKPSLGAAFLVAGAQPLDIPDALIEFDRPVDVVPLRKVLEHAMASSMDPVAADAWLAPRVHAALRLSRREAADQRVWWYLATIVAPEYVRWRFPGGEEGTPPNRFLGKESKNAISRLWWGAEFCRNGSDYGPAAAAMTMQDIPNSFLMDCFHNRPMAVAAVGVLASLNGKASATSDEVTDVLQAANLMLTTTVLDAIAPDPGPTEVAWEKWIEDTSPDWTLMIEEMPQGPEEDSVDHTAFAGAEAFVRRVAATVGLPKSKAPEGDGAAT
jgi:hypothetical protein